MAAHQSGCEVFVAPRALQTRTIGRLEHPPFKPPPEPEAAVASAVAAALDADSPPHLSPAAVHRAAALAVLLRAPLLVSGQDCFRDLVHISSWSMNVASPPADVPLERHLWRAGRALEQTPRPSPDTLAMLLAGDERAVLNAVRERRRAARAVGPELFRGIAARSAGLRAFCVALDLLPGFAASATAREWLRGQPAERALALLAPGIAIFV
ncbi:MAG TPA: hypothetical protein VGQ67_13740 [Candidatus Polarisedimenticolia bacterium]|nr:hypothetical protein [Candidatus Polarisedimenticolia bacterium]